MTNSQQKAVVVTGVSSGIGETTARMLTQQGLRVYGSVRKQADADRLSAALGPLFTPLLFDLTDEAAVRAAAAKVAADLGNGMLYGLVANAGVGLQGPALHQSIADIRQQLEVNVVGLAILTQAFGPLLGADRKRQGTPGRMIVVSSMAGQLAIPLVAGYAAAKHGVEGYAKSLRIELMLYGVDVIILGVGIVATPMWSKWTTNMYEGTDYTEPFKRYSAGMAIKGPQGISPERLGEAIYKALSEPNPPPYVPVLARPIRDWLMQRLMPTRRRDRKMATMLNLMPPAK